MLFLSLGLMLKNSLLSLSKKIGFTPSVTPSTIVKLIMLALSMELDVLDQEQLEIGLSLIQVLPSCIKIKQARVLDGFKVGTYVMHVSGIIK
jgi:hypothetical protein